MTKGSAVVLGATRNVGLYISKKLADCGWSVIGVGRSVPEDNPQTIQFESIDLAHSDAVDKITRLLKESEPNLIVSNAVSYGQSTSGYLELTAVEEIFRVNALVPFVSLSHYLETAQKTTCVIINSDSMFHATRHVGAYAASKAALRVLTTALADTCKARECAVSTLLLGPLADDRKLRECASIADRNGISIETVIKALLKKGNPFYLKESFLQFEECYRSIEYIYSLGAAANGMVCKLDGGASGSLY